MRNRVAFFAIAAVGLTFASCGYRPVDTATMGANPSLEHPVGPIPGVTMQPIGATNPYAHDHTAMEAGRKAFLQFNCYGCHGGHGGGGMGPSLRNPSWSYGSTDADIFNSIAQGRGQGMPAWGTRLPDQQIWELVVYIKTLNTPLEIDPPPPVH